jgi:cytochrome c oxidase assembly factor CtaG
MTTGQFLTTSWNGSPAVLISCAAACALYFGYFRGAGRARFFLAAVAVVLISLVSPLGGLAAGYLFSAHMVQHLLLLLIAPALLLLSLPTSARPAILPRPSLVLGGWAAGIGAMWLWHVPALCDAAASNPLVRAAQAVSLLAMGGAFWWPVLAPAEASRLKPLPAVVYLFAACLACTALGILVTLTPVQVCPIFCQPEDPRGILGMVRGDWGIGEERDRQIGGLIMWVPMCMVYLGAVFAQLARWYGTAAEGGAS